MPAPAIVPAVGTINPTGGIEHATQDTERYPPAMRRMLMTHSALR
jgi:hypothetical protein